MRARLAMTLAGTLAGTLAAGLSACAAPVPPTDASAEDFCEAQETLFADLDLGSGDEPTSDDVAKSLADWADAVEEVGTPADMPDDARAGFERVVELAREAAPEDFDEDGIPALPEELSEKSRAQSRAFTEYVAETCGPGGAGLPEVPELPS